MNNPTPDIIIDLLDMAGDLRIRVVPGAKVERVAVENSVLKIWVRTAPEDGKANKAVVALLARILSLPTGNIQIVKGHTSRDKRVQLTLK
ncbi:DUF167 domain-containing protein [Sphingorhabdus sp.]|uniref:DUF167 domain-containing protein n=1 Tax=Sphingorhabdus sp. TaxID=1902408 RepID=UPI0035932C8E